MLMKFCPWLGCKQTIPQGQRYCATHQEMAEARELSRQKNYNHEIRCTRDKKYIDFYNSPEWQQTRLYILNKYKIKDISICLYSFLISGKTVEASRVHHIEPLKEAWHLRCDINNLIPMSNPAHSMIETIYKTDPAGTKTMLKNLLKRWDPLLIPVGC